MLSLQDELAALANLDRSHDDSATFESNAPADVLMTASSPLAHNAHRTIASRSRNGVPSSLISLSLRADARKATQTSTLRLRTSLDHLKRDKRDTHSPNTLRKLLSEPSDYDGTEYGDPEDDSEPEETFPSLDAAIETFQGCCSTIDETSETDAISRFTRALSELRPQSAVETVASRCIATHETFAAAMPRKVNALRDLSLQVAPGYLCVDWQEHHQADDAVRLDQQMLREALNALEDANRALDIAERPSTGNSKSSSSKRSNQESQLRQETAIDMLSHLQSDTDALLGDLANLADALSMLRQTSLSASRKLRAVRDQVDLLQEELRLAEQSRLSLERDGWHAGCPQRVVARQCREICAGFEGTWQRLRGQLVASA